MDYMSPFKRKNVYWISPIDIAVAQREELFSSLYSIGFRLVINKSN